MIIYYCPTSPALLIFANAFLELGEQFWHCAPNHPISPMHTIFCGLFCPFCCIFPTGLSLQLFRGAFVELFHGASRFLTTSWQVIGIALLARILLLIAR